MFRLRKILLLQLANFYLCASSNPLHAPSNMRLPLQYCCHFDFSERSVWTASRVYICAHQAVELFVSQTITGILSWTRAELEEYLWAQFSQVLLLSLLSNTLPIFEWKSPEMKGFWYQTSLADNEPFSTAERSERVENSLFRAMREYTEAGIEQAIVAMRRLGANSPEPTKGAEREWHVSTQKTGSYITERSRLPGLIVGPCPSEESLCCPACPPALPCFRRVSAPSL